MATMRQFAANRSNSRFSTGPRTAQGRRKSSQNGVRHGLNRPPPHDLVLEYFELYASEHGISAANAHTTELSRSILAIATADAQIDRVLTVIANAPTHEDERKRADFWLDTILMFPMRNEHDAIMRQAVKLIERCERNQINKAYSNPKTLNRYLNAAINARRKAIKRMNSILDNFSEAKPIST